ncbi:MAG TPA: RsmE family RNA methyltransferase [Polyangiaceae bacterium]|jgi:16S rRNA (uracil1498-N3)-methyltransferase|nr:RsmE family RNA methyltransferase [Polyangiaceae bacterium]
MARTLRVPLAALRAGERVLPEAEARYVTRVHRLGVGDVFVAFDPEERLEADVELVHVGRDVVGRLGEPRAARRTARTPVTLLQALGKSDKPERVLRDATALGVEAVVFVETARSVVHLADRAEGRRRRWRAIAVDAARQSGRGDVPEVTGPLSLPEALAVAEGASGRICLSPEATSTFQEVLDGSPPDAHVALLVGPEGGFTTDEVSAAKAAGFTPASFGELVLRTETAAVAALGAIVARSFARVR